MQLIRGLHNLKTHSLNQPSQACVATIGNFDGVHLGHQAVIGQLTEKADELGLPAVVISFEPQPQEFFQQEKSPARLARLREKYQMIRRYAVSKFLCLNFNQPFADMPAEDFIQQVLVDGLAVKYLVVGDDFRFGHQRRGDFTMLEEFGKRHGFEVVNMHSYLVRDQRVSSTLIRQALEVGDMALAEQMLGRPFRMTGKVAHGEKLGRRLGFPTANLHLHRKVSPIDGIFAVEVFGIKGEPKAAVASVGNRPTVNGQKTLLEVYIFDFDEQIYGQYLQVDFLHKLRDQVRFDDLDALTAQIDKDVRETKQFFANRSNSSHNVLS